VHASTLREMVVWDLGVEDYRRAYELQLSLNRLRQARSIPDLLVLLEHRPCLTLGRSSHRENVLAGAAELQRRGIDVHETDRGGDVTYHGPGQLVLYAIVDLGAYGRDVHAHCRRLEQVIIDVVASFGISARRIGKHPGVWTDQGKIAALGIAVKRWVTLHGVALNVSPDMSNFSTIVPCGLADHSVTSLSQILGRDVAMRTVKSRARNAFERVFDVRLVERALPEGFPHESESQS